MDTIEKLLDDIKDFVEKHDKTYIYGAGKYGKAIFNVLEQLSISLAGICVTDKNISPAKIGDLQVVAYDDIMAMKTECHYGFVLAMKEQWQKEVLENHGQDNRASFLPVPIKLFKEINKYLNSCDDVGNISFLRWLEICDVLLRKNCLLFRRQGGIGDLLSLEPVMRKLKKLGYSIALETDHQYLFRHNDSVDFTFKWNCVPEKFDNNCLIFDLTYAHEFHPFMHLVDGYSVSIGELIEVPCMKSEEKIPCYNPLIKCSPSGKLKNICLNNEATNWQSRIYIPERMRQFAIYLKSQGYALYEIGSKEENYLGVGKNCYGLALEETMKLMAAMDLYVGLDNGLMHLAQSIGLPIFVLFGCTCPNFRIYDWSKARVLWKNVDELSCAACHHRRCIPCNRTICSRERIYCMDWTVEEVIEAFENKKYNAPPVLKKEMYSPIKFFDNDEVMP